MSLKMNQIVLPIIKISNFLENQRNKDDSHEGKKDNFNYENEKQGVDSYINKGETSTLDEIIARATIINPLEKRKKAQLNPLKAEDQYKKTFLYEKGTEVYPHYESRC